MRQTRFLLALLAVAAWGAVYVGGRADDKPPKGAPAKPAGKPERAHADRGLVQILVEPGAENEARAYYARIEAELDVDLGNFDLGEAERSTINDLLKYVGYQKADGKGVTANDLETVDSETLMDLAKLKAHFTATGRDPADLVEFREGDVLSARWFAPKITDVAVPEEFVIFGWRKLVRLIPQDGSKAKEKEVAGMFLLFNVFATRDQLTAGSPFDQRSKNNQVILTRGGGSTLSDAAYFLVFGEVKKDDPTSGALIFALNASFDYRHPEAVPAGQSYFVPKACAQCHGAEFEPTNGKLNYLDTDHWFDRTGPGDDFPFVAQSAHGAVFDGGKDQASERFAKAFNVIRALNREVAAQNDAAAPAANGFGLRSVKNWLAIHGDNAGHIKLTDDLDKDGFLDRSIVGDPGVPGGADRWRKNDRIDEALLPMLNRYCYRCHSSVRYSVYDRSAIRLRSGDTLQRFMQRYVSEPQAISFPRPRLVPVPFMPQDRVLPATERTRMVGLLDRLIDS